MSANTIRHLLNWTRGLVRARREKRYIPDEDWRHVCRRNFIPFDRVRLTSDGGLLLHFEHTSIEFPKTPAAFRLMAGYSLLHDLEANTSCRLVWDEQKNMLSLNWGNATYLADDFEELYILREIYFSGDYDFTPAGSTVVVDVGANVGFTSIFLADANPELMVVACEPVPENYAKALKNLAANPLLSERISFYNFGLFSEDGNKTILSQVGNRVRSSIVMDRSHDAPGKTESIPIEVRRASSFIKEVGEMNPGRRIVIKMDCEGSEYHILRNLEADGVLGMVSGFLMEWHKLDGQDDATFIRGFLKRTGFDVCMLGRLQSKYDVGMAYAFRTATEIEN